MKITGLRSFMSRDGDRPCVFVAVDTDEGITGRGACCDHGPDRALPPLLDHVRDPYMPSDGYLDLRPDRPGLGVEIDEDDLMTDRDSHWECKLPIRRDGSTGYT